jgi:hypothetical protein
MSNITNELSVVFCATCLVICFCSTRPVTERWFPYPVRILALW